MPWYNGSARRELEARQRKQAEAYRAVGMTEAQIAEMEAFDLEVLRSDRRFYRHTHSLCPGGRGPEEAPEPGYDGSELPLSSRMDWLEEIEDPALLEALKELSTEMLEILTLLVFEGCTQKEIARYLCCSPQNVNTTLLRLRRFLRRRLARAKESGV